jgi:hypothetical protein
LKAAFLKISRKRAEPASATRNIQPVKFLFTLDNGKFRIKIRRATEFYSRALLLRAAGIFRMGFMSDYHQEVRYSEALNNH